VFWGGNSDLEFSDVAWNNVARHHTAHGGKDIVAGRKDTLTRVLQKRSPYRALDGDGRSREQRHVHSRDEDREEDGDEERNPEDPRFESEVDNPRAVDVAVSRFQTLVDADRLLHDLAWVG